MKTRLPIIFTLLLLVGVLCSACGITVVNGSGNIITEARPVGDFSRVTFSGFGELTLVQGESAGLTIETDDNLLPYLKTTVKTTANGGALTIGFDDGVGLPLMRPTHAIHYILTVKTLTDVDLSGAGTIQADRLTADHLTLTESGAGQITIDQLTAKDLTVAMSGAGTVEVAGQVTHQTVEMSGFGNYQAGDLTSQTANVTLSGAGAATVWVQEALATTLSGAGTISYYGSPQTTSVHSGLGSVNNLGAK